MEGNKSQKEAPKPSSQMRKSQNTNPVPEQNLTHLKHNLIPKVTAFNLTGKKTKTKHPTQKPHHHIKENIQVIKTNILTLRKSTGRTSAACSTFQAKDSTSWNIPRSTP